MMELVCLTSGRTWRGYTSRLAAIRGAQSLGLRAGTYDVRLYRTRFRRPETSIAE